MNVKDEKLIAEIITKVIHSLHLGYVSFCILCFDDSRTFLTWFIFLYSILTSKQIKHFFSKY